MRDPQSIERGAAQLDGLAEMDKGDATEVPADLRNLGWINAAQNDSGSAWPVPQPLTEQTAALDYPQDCLPPVIRDAVIEVQRFVQAPVAMVASSALATFSIAVQAYFDVRRAEKLFGPTSAFWLLLAESGERKSTSDGFFKQPLIDYETEQAELAKPEIAKYKADFAAWEATRSGLLESIKLDAKKGKGSDDTERALQRHQVAEPQTPRVPRLLYSDFTPEKLTYNLGKSWPSAGVLSSEAGAVFGSHSMTGDSLMRTLSILNQLWDGATLTFDRKTTESYSVRGARLTMSLQVQPAALLAFVEKSGDLARGIGFFARFLLACPESTQGTRLYKEPPATWPALGRYHKRIKAILDVLPQLDDGGALVPEMLDLSPEAKAAWIRFHDDVECQLVDGGELTSIRDVASKIADNAVRLAALFHVAQGRIGAITFEDFDNASVIALWHLNESLRFFGRVSVGEEMQEARKLDEWLIANSNRKGTASVMKTEVMRYGPGAVRNQAGLAKALAVLMELGRVRIKTDGRSTEIFINPVLLRGVK